ncbi:C2 domain-containing protein [Dichotomocladium elegans]|nr:C2 domain-containing protein [Dichotomocladium elegans]
MDDRAPKCILTVTIFEARELKNCDMVGKLWIDEKYKQKTSELKNTNSPVWNETFTFNLPEGSDHKLHLEVRDKDPVGSDKIGDAKVDFKDVFAGEAFEEWVKLPAKLGMSSHGEVHLRIEFFPN